MFGYLRILLAFLVLISHLGITFYGLNPGVIAVVIFYILAGYVVSYLYNTIFSQQQHPLRAFYLDRIKRIYPLYLYIFTISLIFILSTFYGQPEFSVLNILYNLSIIPLNYYMILDSTILTTPDWCLIPPAWSLGTELQAYLLLPWVLGQQTLKNTLFLISFAIYLLANTALINADYFGYRLLPGVFFIFLLGTAIQNKQTIDKKIILAIWCIILLLIPIFIYYQAFSPTYTKETFMGLLIGIPLVYLVSKQTITLPFNNFMGKLSYAVFLSHFLAIWLLDYYEISSIIELIRVIEVIILTLLLSITAVFIEKQVRKNNII